MSEATDLYELDGRAFWEALSKIYEPSLLQRFSIEPPKKGHLKIALSEAEQELAAAAAKHNDGQHRFAFILAVSAALRVLGTVGATKEQQEIYRHLYRALCGLDRGSVERPYAA
jgi:hypothetical protein